MNEILPIVGTAVRRLQREQTMKFGTQLTGAGVRFRLWAPECNAVDVAIEGVARPIAMQSLPRGWFEIEVPDVGPGTRYNFILPDGTKVPDPASRCQPGDADGPSEVIDPRAYGWTDAGWRGRPWEETILYELHIGAFTPEGTFLAAIDRLDHLVELGVTAIEVMPVADFSGRWNWGYDGVLHFAPASSYGRPEHLKALIDAAHSRSLMVILDVVYNHFGPEGNYMGLYTPLLTDKHETAWGQAINFDDEGAPMVRDFMLANARYWLNEFHCDGLRFDAVHEIKDSGPKHLLQELAEQIRSATDGRHVHLIAENAANQAGWLKRRDDDTPGFYDAQWSDDIHHGLHWMATGESGAYYADYAGQPQLLGRALAEGLGYQGETTPGGDIKGEPVGNLPATAFVSFIQNHDQVGNRPFGDRITTLAPPAAVRALTSICLLAPEIPLLFMAEEWGSRRPFFYFTDVSEELAEKIRAGRKEEFKESPDGRDPGDALPDPALEATFLASKLDWSELSHPEAVRHLDFYRQLLRIRRDEIVPRLFGMSGRTGRFEVNGRVLRVGWTLGDGSTLGLLANLAPEPANGTPPQTGRTLWHEGDADADRLDPWTVIWTLAAPGR